MLEAVQGSAKGLDTSLPPASFSRPLMHIGIAVSELRYGARNYAIFLPVIDALVKNGINSADVAKPGAIDAAIQSSLDLSFERDCGSVGCVYTEDDKGYSQFIAAAFRIFGFSIRSLYRLFFASIVVVTVIFSVGLMRRPLALIVALSYLAAVCAAIWLLPNSMVASDPADNRFLSTVSGLSALHIALVGMWPEPPRYGKLLTAAAQALVLGVIILTRTAYVWQIMFLVTWLGTLAIVRYWRTPANRARAAAWPTGLLGLTIGLAMVPQVLNGALQKSDEATLSSNYHLFWQPVAMGLAFHPDGFPLYGFGTRDWDIYNVTYKYLEDRPDVARDLQINLRDVVFEGSPPYANFSNVGWGKYDQAVGRMFAEFAAGHPRMVIETYLYYHPRYTLEQILWQLGLEQRYPAWIEIDPVHVPAHGDRLNALSVPAVLLWPLASLMGAFALRPRQAVLLACLGLTYAAWSLFPMLATIPFYQEMGGATVAVAAALSMLVAAMAGYLGASVRRARALASACRGIR